jgi:hypothetical protein
VRDDAEVIPSASQSPIEVWGSALRDLGYGAICEDYFVVKDVVDCPAVSPRDERYSAFASQKEISHHTRFALELREGTWGLTT